MARMTSRYSRVHLELAARRIGALQVAAIALVVAALVLRIEFTARALEGMDRAREDLVTLSAPPEAAPAEHAGPYPLAAFESILVERSTLSDVIAKLFLIAHEHRLELGRGEYRLARDAAGGFSVYHMSLPIEGRYPAIRRFAEAVLDQWPGISLEGVKFSRRHAGAPDAEAVLHWALLVSE